MKKLLALLLVVSTLFSITACAKTPEEDVIGSDEPRDTSPEVNLTDREMLVEGNNEFAFDLYRELKRTDENFFYSPYSISQALAMTWAGARSTTETAMKETMNFTLPQGQLHPAFNALDLELDNRGKGAGGSDGKGFRLNIVNAIWGQKDYEFLQPFLDTLAQNYGAGLRTVDYINETEKSRITINDWVSEQTEDKIKDLIPQGVIDDMTRLVLTNAVYFNAAWQHPFEESSTSDGTFYLIGGDEVTVPMMRQTESFDYTKGSNYQAVDLRYELPYDGKALSMLIILPDSGKFEAFENELDADLVEGIIDSFQYSEVALTMPKFEYESGFSLKDALATMGMEVAFTENADFSGMDGTYNLLIQDVMHKAYVKVNEAGTEAAAATAVVVGLESAPVEIIDFTVNRPFIFLIRDIETNTIIFAGRVLNPEG